MRLVYLITAAALLGAGLATASPLQAKGEESLTLDLTSAGGPMLFLKCSRDRALTNCGVVSLWQQTNPIQGLQTGIFNYGSTPYQPDDRLLP